MTEPGWTPSVPYKVGDQIKIKVPRSWFAIWRDRLTSLQWSVPTVEERTCVVRTTAPGGINYF